MDPLKQKPSIKQWNGRWWLILDGRHRVTCASWDDAMLRLQVYLTEMRAFQALLQLPQRSWQVVCYQRAWRIARNGLDTKA